jgi:replicative superfamily II helicase
MLDLDCALEISEIPDHPVYGKLAAYYSLEMLDFIWSQFNIKSLHDWQIECLCLPKVKQGSNLIFSAPTSAGKSIVCDMLYLRTLLA